jgi:hypothetical protein
VVGLFAFAVLALACGRLKVQVDDAAGPTDAGVSTEAPAGLCLLSAPSIVASNLCIANPELCGVACGTTCVNLATDNDNCGACGVVCTPLAACDAGVCGAEPTELVAPAPGCRSMRLALEDGMITWADLGHGTINRVATGGGPVTTLATGVLPAVIYTGGEQPLVMNGEPRGAEILVHAGVTYWVEAADRPTFDEAGLAHGGAGVAIEAVSPGAAPVTLLPAALAPGPSPVSSIREGGVPIETPGEKPPISAIALSPDGRTLYFGAGTRLYKIPSAGAVTAADVQLVGFTSNERGFATALAADDHRLFFPSTVDTWVELYDLTKTCDPTSTSTSGSYGCADVIFGSDPIPLLDTVTVTGHFLTWAKETNVWRADLTATDPTVDGHVIFSDTVDGFDVTGFAVGAHNAYFGENASVEKGGFNTADGTGPPPAHVLARGQTWPSSLLVDGTNVYWTTTACDIAFIADSPQ